MFAAVMSVIGRGITALVLAAVCASAASAQALASAQASAQAPASRSVLFVGNVFDGTVTLIDAASLRVLRTVNVTPDGKTPQDAAQATVYPAIVARQGVNYVQGLAVSPDGRMLYVSRGWLGDVAAFRLDSGAMLWRLQVNGIRADHIALSPDGRRLFVSALSANEVQVIDTRTRAFVGSFPTGDFPHVLEFSRDGRYIYNGSLGNQLLPRGADGRHLLTVADPNSLQVLRTYSFPDGVRPFALTADATIAFVQLSYLSGFVEVDLRTGQIIRTVSLPVSGPGARLAPKDYPNQAAHHGIALTPSERMICDAGTISNYAALLSVPSLDVLAIVPTGDQPAEAISSSDGRYCFLSDRGPAGNAVSVISFSQRREIARIPVGNHPQEEEIHTVPDAVLGVRTTPAAVPAPAHRRPSRTCRRPSRTCRRPSRACATGRSVRLTLRTEPDMVVRSVSAYVDHGRVGSVLGNGRTVLVRLSRNRAGRVTILLVVHAREDGQWVTLRQQFERFLTRCRCKKPCTSTTPARL